MVDLGHKSAFDLLLKEAWNPEVSLSLSFSIDGFTNKSQADKKKIGGEFIE